MGEEPLAEEILIVDNDERIVELVAWFLRKRGYRVLACESFDAARAHLARSRPDLMLSDVDLGEASALEELPRLSREGLLPPTLIVSGYLDAEITSALTSLPEVLETLAKPFDFSALEERVRACLELARTEFASRRGRSGGTPQVQATVQQQEEDADGWIEITAAMAPAVRSFGTPAEDAAHDPLSGPAALDRP